MGRLKRASLARADPALVAFMAEGFFSRLSFGILTFVVPLFALKQGMSLAEIGFLLSVNVIVSIALKTAMGAVADKIGYKHTLTAAILMRSGVTLMYALAVSPALLFAARGLHGVSIALRDPALGALIAEHGGKKKVAQTFAWWQTAKSLAGNGSKVAGGLLLALTASNFQLVFFVAFGLSLLPLFVVLRHLPEGVADDAEDEEDPEAEDEPSEPLTRSRMLSFAGLGLMISLTAYMVGPLFPIIMVAYAGVSPDQAGLIYALSGCVALASPAFGWLSDNVSNKLVLSIRSVANIGSSVLYIVAPTLAGVAAGRVVDDLGKAAFKPAWGKLMADVSSLDKRRRARLMGSMSSGEDAGEALGPIVAGLIMNAWTIPAMFGVRIVLAAATEIYTVALTRKRAARERKPFLVARIRAAIPAHAIAGLVIGLGAGIAVDRTNAFAPADSRAASPDAVVAGPHSPSAHAGGCSTDPTIRAIRKAIGRC